MCPYVQVYVTADYGAIVVSLSLISLTVLTFLLIFSTFSLSSSEMGCCLKLILFLHVSVAALVGILFWGVLTDRFPPMPEVPEVG